MLFRSKMDPNKKTMNENNDLDHRKTMPFILIQDNCAISPKDIILENLRKGIIARKIQRTFKKHIKSKNQIKLQAAINIQRLYRGWIIRKQHGSILKHKFKLYQLRKALLIGWKIRSIFKSRKIQVLKKNISDLSNTCKKLRRRKIENFITLVEILYRTGSWIRKCTEGMINYNKEVSSRDNKSQIRAETEFSKRRIKEGLENIANCKEVKNFSKTFIDKKTKKNINNELISETICSAKSENQMGLPVKLMENTNSGNSTRKNIRVFRKINLTR